MVSTEPSLTQDDVIEIFKRLIELDRDRPDHVRPDWVFTNDTGWIEMKYA